MRGWDAIVSCVPEFKYLGRVFEESGTDEAVRGKEKEISRIRAVQTYNLRCLLGIRRMDKIPKSLISELCGVTKEVDENIDEGVLRWFGHVGEGRMTGLLRGSM